MLKLCGFSVSNYFNKVKFALYEKEVTFEEELAYPAQTDTFLKDSPIGKVPFLRTDRGNLSESQVIVEYIEEVYPQPPLFPADAYDRARCRELIEHIELHLELPVRRLYAEAFFGGKVSDATKAEVETAVPKGLRSLGQLARFAPFIAGESFTHADCAAWVHLPLIGQTTKKIFGRDMVAEMLPAAAGYLQRIGSRPHAIKLAADRDAAMTAFFASKK